MTNNRSVEVDTVGTPKALFETAVYEADGSLADCYGRAEVQINGVYAGRIRELSAVGATGFTVRRMAEAFQDWATDITRLSAIMPDDRPALATRYLDAMEKVAPGFGKAWALTSVAGSTLEDAMREVLGAS